jgi:subtilisin family serine protease
MRLRRVFFPLASGLLLGSVGPARAQTIDGAAIVRLLGPRAHDALAPRGSGGVGALVRLPPGVRAADVGLREAAPGFGRIFGSPPMLLAYADAHPGLTLEVAPPLHPLLDTAATYIGSRIANESGLDGSGIAVGIADLGIDVTHPDFLDDRGKTRVAWMLDVGAPAIGLHPDLEQKFGSTDASGNPIGAVWAAADIDGLLARGATGEVPQDDVGHGTLVASCAAGNGMGGSSPYRGVAPKATLLIARVGSSDGSIAEDDLLRGVEFLFDRASALGLPAVVNLSLGSDFGPHDGTTAWEQVLSSYVGPEHPGRALVAAAGNSGSIADQAVHANVFVADGATVRVPIPTGGAMNGGVQVWVAMHPGTGLKVGLDGPDGTWISPVPGTRSAGKNTSDYNAAVYNGSQPKGSVVPAQSHGAVVIWQGHWPVGTYSVTLTGSGTADLWVEPTGDATGPDAGVIGFNRGVRESTITLPATAPSIIGVGCTINKPTWADSHGVRLKVVAPVLDAYGGLVDSSGAYRDTVGGEPCWFSSAGPTLTGLQKPEIMAPGAAIVGAMSQQAAPPLASSIFTNPACPGTGNSMSDQTCQQVDGMHAASFGTSFSAPLVAGTVALLLQHDPTLTQDQIVAALQGGAHKIRGPFAYEDQLGAGEVDVLGSVAAADRIRDPQAALPVRAASWLTLGADTVLADGSTPLQAIVELRSAQGAPADGFDETRLVPYALVDGSAFAGAVASFSRRGPGVWVATVQLPAGLGGSTLTVGVTFDGADIVAPRTVPVATDAWTAGYPSSASGGCSVAGAGEGLRARWACLAAVCVFIARTKRRRRGAAP